MQAENTNGRNVASNGHNGMRAVGKSYDEATKRAIVTQVIDQGISVRQVSKKEHVSEGTIHKWLKNWKQKPAGKSLVQQAAQSVDKTEFNELKKKAKELEQYNEKLETEMGRMFIKLLMGKSTPAFDEVLKRVINDKSA